MSEMALKVGAETYSSAIATADRYTRWIVETFRPFIGRRLLEVGVGHGGHRGALPALERYVGIDLDAAAVAAAPRLDPSDRLLVGDVSDPAVARLLAEERLDTVLCVNVLEHIEDDGAAVANLLGILVPGGHLLLFLPAFPALFSAMDRLAGHRRRYVKSDLARLAARAGGTLRESRYFNPLGGLGWWANRWLPHRSLNAGAVNGQIRFFDRFALPVSRRLDPLFRGIFGQSLVGVLEAP